VSRRHARQDGFTLIELLIVIIIIAILAAIATGAYAAQREDAKQAACRSDMRSIEGAEKAHVAQSGTASVSLQGLVDEHLLDRVPSCPDGGVYSWVSDADGDVELACSIHGTVSGAPAAQVASTFTTTSDYLIKLTLDYYAKHGSWPRSWAPYCYTDLGLDPAQWAGALDHVFYKVGGSRVSARPEAGYVLTVTDTSGKQRVLNNKLSWDLVYDTTSGAWYYHTIDPANQIDISTLTTTPG